MASTPNGSITPGTASGIFQGRFGGILVEKETHLLELIRYIVLNPVRAGMVRDPADHRWSSYRGTVGLTAAPPWLEVGWTLAQFHPTDRTEATTRYREFVGAKVDPAAVWQSLHGGIFLGSDRFVAQMQSEHPECGLKPASVSLDRIHDVVERAGQSTKSARLMFVHLARRLGRAPLKEISARLRLSDSRISALMKEASRLLGKDSEFARLIEEVERKVET